MPIPSRILRTRVEDHLGRPEFTNRQRDHEAHILAAAEDLFATYGRHEVTWRSLGESLRMATATLRWHYTDLHALFAAILSRHLRNVAKALGEVPLDAPNRRHAQCLAYLAATRLPFGGLTPAHLLLTRDRHTLPEDVLDPIEEMRHSLGMLVGGNLGQETLDRLDTPWVTAESLGPVLEILVSPPPPAPPLPEPALPAPSRSADIARQLENGDLRWLRPAGLGSLEDPLPEPRMPRDELAQLRDENLDALEQCLE